MPNYRRFRVAMIPSRNQTFSLLKTTLNLIAWRQSRQQPAPVRINNEPLFVVFFVSSFSGFSAIVAHQKAAVSSLLDFCKWLLLFAYVASQSFHIIIF